MELGNFLVAFFTVIIFLTIISIFSFKDQTGQFLKPTNNLDSAFVLILISMSVIFFIKMPKKYYRPIPRRA